MTIKRDGRGRVRNYRLEYLRDHASKIARKLRGMRNKANREENPPPGYEVDHKKPLSKGGGNGKSNRRVVKRSVNRRKADKVLGKVKKAYKKKAKQR